MLSKVKTGDYMNYENTIPLYIQISNDMMSKIENNVYKGMLPSEKEFVNIYQVSRVTIRKALDKLEKEKIITRRAGFGTKINSNKDDLTHSKFCLNLCQIQVASCNNRL